MSITTFAQTCTNWNSFFPGNARIQKHIPEENDRFYITSDISSRDVQIIVCLQKKKKRRTNEWPSVSNVFENAPHVSLWRIGCESSDSEEKVSHNEWEQGEMRVVHRQHAGFAIAVDVYYNASSVDVIASEIYVRALLGVQRLRGW